MRVAKSPRLDFLLSPENRKVVLLQECGGQVGLWVQIDGEDPAAEALKHVSEVVGKSGLPNAALVIEQRDRPHVALLNVTDHDASSIRNSAGGLPLARSASCILPMPRPKRFT